MDYYKDVYIKRLNRYGDTYSSRIQGEREESFEDLLLKSVNRVGFEFSNREHFGVLERYKQDDTKTLQYLLTRTSLDLPNGTILSFYGRDVDEKQTWMVYYLENIRSSGYNKYILLKMSHFITWTGREGGQHSSWAYMYGQKNSSLRDDLKSSKINSLYGENSKSDFFIMPLNEFIKRDDYLVVGEGTPFAEAYRVTGYDIQSSEGVEYVTIDPVYMRDNSPIPEKTEDDVPEDFFWFEGGV